MDSMQQMFFDYTHLQKINVHILSQQNAVMGNSTYVNVFFCVCETHEYNVCLCVEGCR